MRRNLLTYETSNSVKRNLHVTFLTTKISVNILKPKFSDISNMPNVKKNKKVALVIVDFCVVRGEIKLKTATLTEAPFMVKSYF